ncbi:MAG: hypothetical protein WCJ97_04160, partial [Phycisphaerae bacterium]
NGNATFAVSAAGMVTRSVVATEQDNTVVNVNNPTLKIEKLSDTAEGGTPGIFRITRSGNMGSAVWVYFGYSGSALNGSDYSLSGNGIASNFIIMSAGSAYADITVLPKADQQTEVPETLTVTLTANALYNLDAAKYSATMTITDRV